ncbi:MAG: ferrous iron transport protein A [Gemmatimonadaceae bacterium]|nr:ferrous iron transport protein A [Gemmatimonadaceae bacterium]
MTTVALPIADSLLPSALMAPTACRLGDCVAGARATVVSLGCGENEACRLRELGLMEGASINIVDARHCMLLDVRGSRFALSPAITAGITVLPSR